MWKADGEIGTRLEAINDKVKAKEDKLSPLLSTYSESVRTCSDKLRTNVMFLMFVSTLTDGLCYAGV
jgi:hypothetical protein